MFLYLTIFLESSLGMFMAYSSIVINRVGLKGAQEKISNEFLPVGNNKITWWQTNMVNKNLQHISVGTFVLNICP